MQTNIPRNHIDYPKITPVEFRSFAPIPIVPLEIEGKVYYRYPLHSEVLGAMYVYIPGTYQNEAGEDRPLNLQEGADEIFFLDEETLAIVKEGGEEVFLAHLFTPADQLIRISEPSRYSRISELGGHIRSRLDSLFVPHHHTSRQVDVMRAVNLRPTNDYGSPLGHCSPVSVLVRPWSSQFISFPKVQKERANEVPLLDPAAVRHVIMSVMPGPMRKILCSSIINLQSLFPFTSLYNHVDDDQKDQILKIFVESPRRSHILLINAFSACGMDVALATKLIEMANCDPDYALPVLDHCEKLNQLEEIILRGSIEEVLKLFNFELLDPGVSYFLQTFQQWVEKGIFRAIIQKRKNAFLKLALQKKTNLDELFAQFDPEEEKWSAVIQAVAPKLSLPKDAQVLTALLKGTNVQSFKGEAGIIVGEDMGNPEVYSERNKFGPAQYNKLIALIDGTYTDKGYAGVLIRRIPSDLRQEEVTWTILNRRIAPSTMRDLIGTCKIRKEGDRTYYIGTLYVNPDYRKGGIGSILERFALSSIPEGSIITATVAVGNCALERHTDLNWVGYKIDREFDEIGTSGDLIKIMRCVEGQYSSKNLNKGVLRQMVDGSQPLPEGLKVFKTSSAQEDEVDFSNLLTREYEGGAYVLTRVFYDKDAEGKPDLKSTYVVFQKRMVVK